MSTKLVDIYFVKIISFSFDHDLLSEADTKSKLVKKM